MKEFVALPVCAAERRTVTASAMNAVSIASAVALVVGKRRTLVGIRVGEARCLAMGV
jgi:hypothetical protein